MTERTPIQISGSMVLCEDKTIWKYDGPWWVKLAPIPTDEEYEAQQDARLEWEQKWIQSQLEKSL